MDHHDVVSDGLSDFIFKWDINEEVLSDCLQGIFWPGEEPIYVGVAD